MRGKRVGGLVVAACLALALPTTAEASTLTGTLEYSSRGGDYWYMYYHYGAAAGERNDLTVTELRGLPLRHTFVERGTLIGPLGGIPIYLGVVPPVPVGVVPVTTCVPALLLVTCVSVIDVAYVDAYLGDRDDRARGEGNGSLQLFGETGNDTLGGGAGSESMHGGPGADTFLGGAGHDHVDYAPFGSAVSVTLDGVANDGAPGEQDNVGGDIESLRLTGVFVGNDNPQQVITGSANDQVETRGGNDAITLAGGADVVDAGSGDDKISLPNDGAADTITCGAGNDTVTRVGGPDPSDIIYPDCEVVS